MLAESLALAALVVVPLAQVPLVAFLSRYVALDADADRPDPREGYVTYGTRGSRPTGNPLPEDAGERACPHCGRVVPEAFDYCGECATRVPERGGPR